MMQPIVYVYLYFKTSFCHGKDQKLPLALDRIPYCHSNIENGLSTIITSALTAFNLIVYARSEDHLIKKNRKIHIHFIYIRYIHTIQLKSLNIALNNYFTDYPDSKQYGGIRDGPTDFKSEDIFCYALGPK